MEPILVVADDVTGAADSAARCRHAGLRARIVLDRPVAPLAPGLTACTSDSRHLSPRKAAARVRRLIEPLRNARVRWYKKIDSTLRGNVGSELDAVLDVLDLACAVVCPAFPAQGRSVEDGYLHAPHPLARSVHLPSLLAQQGRRSVAFVPLAIVRDSATTRSEHLAQAARDAQVLAADAVTEEDLQRILAGVSDALPDALLCGSAGLVGALAERLASTAGRATMDATATDASPAPVRSVLVVVGSGSKAARHQVEALCRGKSETARVIIEPDTDAAEVAAQCGTAGPVCVLHLPKAEASVDLDSPAARACATHLADVTAAVVARADPGALILVGGDTAAAVLKRLRITRLDVLAELLPGMPCTAGADAAGHSRRIVLKPGSFGSEDVLTDLVDRMLTRGR